MKSRVLVAEDDRELRRLIVQALEKDGHDVESVGSGPELLHRLGTASLSRHRGLPDLVVTDIRMPGLSGLEVLSGVRELAWTTPAILMTAFGDDEVAAAAHRLDAMLFHKPFDFDDLRTAVLHVLRQSSAAGRQMRNHTV